MPQALIGQVIPGLKGVTKFSCLDGFARQGALFDKVSEDIQDRGIAWSHQSRAFLLSVSNPANCACKAGASVAVTGFQWHSPLCAV
uniref:Uncharacterized protein n=1 Tax=uncultured alpha proteobacterium HF0070_17D04 TaxID=710805 RepID=E0XSA6_9PROT|nr:hypothetical protein [uncultured alpha proteobacterium HF0070_17D04]